MWKFQELRESLAEVRPLVLGGEEAAESCSIWEHFTTRGHRGKVLSIASSDETDFIVSGGEDSTMRIWRFDQATASYDLCAVLWHDHNKDSEEAAASGEAPAEAATGVTAVACAGMRGPFFSGTSSGDLFILYLGIDEAGDPTEEGGMVVPYPKLSLERINEICVPSHLGEFEERWAAVGVASDDGASLLRLAQVGCEVIGGLPHNGNAVKGIRHIAGGGELDANFATLTEKAVFIWNLHLEPILTLDLDTLRNGLSSNPEMAVGSIPETSSGPSSRSFVDRCNCIQDIATSNKHNGTLLFVGTEEILAVWGFQGGQLCGPHGEVTIDRRPLVVYREEARHIDVDQSTTRTNFLVDLRDNEFTCAVWNLQGVEPSHLAIEPRGPASLLAAPRRKEMLLDLWHSSKITNFRVAEDPGAAGGPCLIVACDDGSVKLWDLEGVDRGEIYADLRSLRPLEIVLPVVFLTVTFLQVMSFAFGPDEWNDKVKAPTHFTRKIVWGEIDWVVRLPKEDIFLPLLWVVLVMMCFFLLVTVIGLPEFLNYLIHVTQSTREYRLERRRTSGKLHLLKRVLEALRWPLYTIVWLMSTVLVAPMFKVCAQAISCESEDGGTNSTKYLHAAPNVVCWEGIHLYLARWVFFIVPVYFIVLIPLGAVEGDVRYMSVLKLFFPWRYWADSAHRKATRLNFGPLHPNPSTVFRTLSLDMASRALLPVIETWFAHRPVTQMVLITLVGAAMYVFSRLWPPKNHDKFTCLVRGTRLFTFCAMACGLVTVLLPKSQPESLPLSDLVPTLILVICLVVVPWHTFREMRRSALTPPLVQHCHTSTGNLVDEAAELTQQGTNIVHTPQDNRTEDLNVVWVGESEATHGNLLRRERSRMGTLSMKKKRVRLPF